MGELHEEALTQSIIGAFFEVYNRLGFGLSERDYAGALDIELRLRGHRVSPEVPIEVWYRGHVLGLHRLDMVVDRKVIVENKATHELHPSAARQCFTYLSASRLEVGLVLRFGPKPNVKRVVNPTVRGQRYTSVRDGMFAAVGGHTPTGDTMAHTHEYDCVVCGAHFDSQEDLGKHNRENHTPKQKVDVRADAEPMGNEHRRASSSEDEPRH
jgi:GxxExxY protein